MLIFVSYDNQKHRNMKLAEKLSTKELETLMAYKPDNVDLDILNAELERRGYSNMLSHFGGIVEDDLYNEVQSRESVSWIIEYISWHIKDKLFVESDTLENV